MTDMKTVPGGLESEGLVVRPSFRDRLLTGGTATRLFQLLFYAVLVGAWEFGVPALNIPSYLLPVPSQIISSLIFGLTQGTYLDAAYVTLFETFSGFAIAVVGGLLVGAAIVELRFVEIAIYPLVVGLQSLPKIALAPLILIWAGFGIRSKIIVAALVAFFPVLVNTVAGLRAYDREAAELMKSLGASRWQMLHKLKAPSAVPYILAGLQVAFVFALLGAIVGEFVGASAGLGHNILQMQFQLDVAGVFAILIIMAAIGILGHALLKLIGERLAFWETDITARS